MKTSYCSVQPTTQNCLGTFEFRVLPFGTSEIKFLNLLNSLTDRTFENRWSRYKEIAENKAEAYRVYVEHLFSACDAVDARIFSKGEETGLYYYGARYLDPKYSRWLSGDPALSDYIPKAPIDDESKKHNENLPGMGGVFNVVNLHLYHYAGNNPIKYEDPDGRCINFVIGPAVGFFTSVASEVGLRMASGQSFGDALNNTFSDKTSRAVIATSTAIGALTAGVSGAIVTNAAKTATIQIAKRGAVSASKIIASNVAKTVAINTVSGAVDAGLKDVASKAIKGKKQSISETLQTMGKGAAYAFVASGLTQAAIGSCSTSTSRVPNLLTGTVEDFEIQQPKWAGAAGVVGESVIPTVIDMYHSLNQKSELR